LEFVISGKFFAYFSLSLSLLRGISSGHAEDFASSTDSGATSPFADAENVIGMRRYDFTTKSITQRVRIQRRRGNIAGDTHEEQDQYLSDIFAWEVFASSASRICILKYRCWWW